MGVWLCVCACVGVWVCGCVGGCVCVWGGGGNKGAGAKKYESVSDLIGLRGWSWMLELDAGAGCWSFLRQFKVVVVSCS